MVSAYMKRAVMSRRESIKTDDYEGDDRRESKGVVGRAEFDDYVNCTTQYRIQNNLKLDEQKKALSETTAKVEAVHTAMFAKTQEEIERNGGQPGLMHTARRIEQHIDAVCNVAKWLRAAIIAIGTTLAAIGGAGKAFGIW